uniref:ribosomal protein L18 n=1 Tax=Hypnea musciformis TaxID=31429 RepID=UPI0027D9EDD3|nr:ribosomal protein L18 [Hypnea musciformis]WCH56974.1 ribosomal protein L18 [Hypnea musciformis]WCH57174.1 ribosomal protein L18 [Hypnea musciformis]
MKKKIQGNSQRPRLYVFRSKKHIYVQIIDDISQKILLSSSSIAKDLKVTLPFKNKANSEISILIGKDIAKKAKTKGIKSLVFDRGKRLYHGRIKALADSIRQEGIKF